MKVDEIVNMSFNNMKRSELQKRAKKVGIKANMKTECLISALQEYYTFNKDVAKMSEESNNSSASDKEEEKTTETTSKKRGKGRKQVLKADIPTKEELKESMTQNVGPQIERQEEISHQQHNCNVTEEIENKPPQRKRSGRKGKKSNETVAESKQEINKITQKRLHSPPTATEAPVNKRRRTVITPKAATPVKRNSISRTTLNRKSNENKSLTQTPKQTSGKKIRRSTFDGKQADKAEAIETKLSTPGVKSNQVPVKKLSSIPVPKFHAPKLTPGQTFDFTKLHKNQFQKMESIDDYLERKRKRIEALTGGGKKVKVNSPAVSKVAQPRKSTGTPSNSKVTKPKISKPSSSFFSPKPTKGVSFQASKLKPPVAGSITKKVVSTPGVRKSTVGNTPGVRKSTAGNTPGARMSVAVTQMSRKSIGTENRPQEIRKSVGVTSVTPFKFSANSQPMTPASKKKAFDLKASLDKKLNYKPYTGKLKPLTETTANQKPVSHIEKAKRDYKAPKVTSRMERQKSAMKHQAKKRENRVMARRGLSMA